MRRARLPRARGWSTFGPHRGSGCTTAGTRASGSPFPRQPTSSTRRFGRRRWRAGGPGRRAGRRTPADARLVPGGDRPRDAGRSRPGARADPCRPGRGGVVPDREGPRSGDGRSGGAQAGRGRRHASRRLVVRGADRQIHLEASQRIDDRRRELEQSITHMARSSRRRSSRSTARCRTIGSCSTRSSHEWPRRAIPARLRGSPERCLIPRISTWSGRMPVPAR